MASSEGQAGRDVIFDVLEEQFLKALHQDGGESYRGIVIKTRHSRLYWYSCLEAAIISCESEISEMSVRTSASSSA